MNEPVIKQSGIRDVTFGTNVTVVNPCNLYGCTIGDDSFIGPFVEVQGKVNIGSRTRIQSHTFICELTEIGDDCFIGHGVMFVNDLFSDGGPAYGKPEKWAGAKIGNHVSIGSNASILPVNICDRVVIGAGAVVTRDITEPGVYTGVPARKTRSLEP